jgi:hypothetical protein
MQAGGVDLGEMDLALQKACAIATLELPKGQVAQLVERSPEKAGVGGSIPSLATIQFRHLQVLMRKSEGTERNTLRSPRSSNLSRHGPLR